jgi:hypothetical protein
VSYTGRVVKVVDRSCRGWDCVPARPPSSSDRQTGKPAVAGTMLEGLIIIKVHNKVIHD